MMAMGAVAAPPKVNPWTSWHVDFDQWYVSVAGHITMQNMKHLTDLCCADCRVYYCAAWEVFMRMYTYESFYAATVIIKVRSGAGIM